MQAIDTSKLETALKEMREKVKSVSQENGIDISKGEIAGHVIFDGNWGDYTIDNFGFYIYRCIDKSDHNAIGLSREEYDNFQKLVRPIEREYNSVIGDFVEQVLDFEWDDAVDFAHWYQENGGEGIFKFVLCDDKIEVNVDLALIERKADTQYALQVGFYNGFWTDKQKEHLRAIDQLGLEYIIRAEFSGSGDSGGYDGSYVFEDFECSKCIPRDEYKPILDKIDDDLSSIGYTIMDSASIDWYNNEGGGGHILVDTKNKKVHVDVWQNFDESETVWADKIVFQN